MNFKKKIVGVLIGFPIGFILGMAFWKILGFW